MSLLQSLLFGVKNIHTFQILLQTKHLERKKENIRNGGMTQMEELMELSSR